MTATESKKLLTVTEQEIAGLTGMSLSTVRRWRQLGEGPRYLKLGASVRYRLTDVEAWLDSRPSGGERVEDHQSATGEVAATA